MIGLNNCNFSSSYYPNPFDISTLQELRSVKNAPLEAAIAQYSTTPIADVIQYQKNLLLSCAGSGGAFALKYKYFSCDVKVHSLEEGQVPCIPGWHIDGGQRNKSIYALMVVGVSRTQICLEKLSYPDRSSDLEFCAQFSRLEPKEVRKLEDWEIMLYDNLMMHRGTPAVSDGLRLLVRTMASDWKPARFSHFTPSTY